MIAGSGEIGSADGPGAAATFTQPHGMGVSESRGVAFVADTFMSCIRSVELATGKTTTIAGTCGEGGHRDTGLGSSALDARFNHVHKVTVDPRNESILYVTEAECSDDGPLEMTDPCKQSAAGVVYFAGVRKLELHPDGAVATVSTAAGAFDPAAPTASLLGFADGSIAAAKFHYVHDVQMQPVNPAAAVQRGGSTVLMVMDDNNNRVRMIDLDAGTVSTVAGSGAAGCADGPGPAATFAYHGAVGVAVGRDGTVYVADYSNHKVRKVAFGPSPTPPTPPSPFPPAPPAPPAPPSPFPVGTQGNGTCGDGGPRGQDCSADSKGWYPGCVESAVCGATTA